MYHMFLDMMDLCWFSGVGLCWYVSDCMLNCVLCNLKKTKTIKILCLIKKKKKDKLLTNKFL